MPRTERTPAAVLDFWFGPMRSAADASEAHWRERMVLWKIGPLARVAEDPGFRAFQRAWCEQVHREGVDRFFADPAWDTPRGRVAKLIILDQFPRSTWRGTPPAFAWSTVTEPLAREICQRPDELAALGVLERMWVYMPLTHSEDPGLHELAVERFFRWHEELMAAIPPAHRRINQYVSWAFLKATVEHAEVILLHGRFPHRNAIFLRPHRAGEAHYLKDPMRPLWTFTQPPNPDYTAVFAALRQSGQAATEERIPRPALAWLHRAAAIPADAPHALMDVLDLAGADSVDCVTLYRHLLLPEKAPALAAILRLPQVAHAVRQVRRVLLRDPGESWPPRSPRKSIQPVIDVEALAAIIRGGAAAA